MHITFANTTRPKTEAALFIFFFIFIIRSYNILKFNYRTIKNKMQENM